MRKIVALGGGQIGRPGQPIETTKIDREIIRLTGKKRPNLLFIPTASTDSESYYEVVKKHFIKRLGCKTDVLYLIKKKARREEIRGKMLGSDIIYVGGGNTLKMMKIWRKHGVDTLLKKAHKKGIVLSGISAGAMCWFRWGNSDSRRFNNPKADSIRVSGLGMINALLCPHYDHEKRRKPSLKKMMRKTPGVAIALDNCCAFEVVGDKYRVISSKPRANAYRVYWKGGIFHQETIGKEQQFRPLSKLLSCQKP